VAVGVAVKLEKTSGEVKLAIIAYVALAIIVPLLVIALK
jgi:hypothetical protein